MRLRIRPQARLDMLETWHFIARHSIDAADRLEGQFRSAFRRLADMPGLGHSRVDVPLSQYRFYAVGKYVIAYRTDGATLEVVRVVHGARDFRSLFPPSP